MAKPPLAAVLPLFQAYPSLVNKLAHLPLCDLPTPLETLQVAGTSVAIKRDDVTAERYAGNKVRKLEFALGEAKRRGAKEILTFGFAGSNSATACAVHAQANGLRSISMLLPQPPEPYVADNLRLSYSAGAELHEQPTTARLAVATGWQMLRHTLKVGKPPMVIPAGVSSPLGVVAYVNAGFELAEQIASGQRPMPDRIYVAMGTGGTAAGLWLGCAAAGLPCTIVAVRVVDAEYCNRQVVEKLAGKVAKKLSGFSQFPAALPAADTLEVINEQFGEAYGVPTEATNQAITAAQQVGLALDITYTGKAFAQLLADANAGKAQRPLFWLTKNSQPTPTDVREVQASQLPQRLRRYLPVK